MIMSKSLSLLGVNNTLTSSSVIKYIENVIFRRLTQEKLKLNPIFENIQFCL